MDAAPASALNRIRQGDTVSINVTSNTTPTSIRARVGVRYDNGVREMFSILVNTAMADRVLRTFYPGTNVQSFSGADNLFRDDGYVEWAQVISSGLAQRGMCYVAFVVTDQSAYEKQTLCADYLWIGNSLTLGHIVSPGPAGGHGNIIRATSADPAAGTEVAVTAFTCPTGAIWRVITFTVQLVQGITQTPLPTLRKTGTNGVQWQIPVSNAQIGASTTAQLTWGRGLVQTSFVAVVGDEFHTAPIPDGYLIATEFVTTVTDGIGANTNYGAAVAEIEEWVIPN